MNNSNSRCFWGSIFTFSACFIAASTSAQIVPDATLPVNSTVNSNGDIFTIDGGTRAGGNLFHSFQEFSVPTGKEAFFNQALDVQNILTRVTGDRISNIDGSIRTNGVANLFLINPNGIIFGAGARLNLNGSFVVTTADRIRFTDASFFSATNLETSPLLTVSAPIGLQLGANAAAIRVEGEGNIEILRPDSTLSPVKLPGLQVATGQTLALVGGAIDIVGGNLIAPEGQVELWGVQNAEVAIDNSRWQLTNFALPEWGTISLRQAALVNASGNAGGAIQIRGRGLRVEQGSHIAANTQSGQGRGITVQTTEFVDLLGVSAPNPLADRLRITPGQPLRTPGIEASVSGTGGKAGDITLETGRLQVADGAWLQSISTGDSSKTGNITVRASDVEVKRYNQFDSVFFSVSAITNLIVGRNGESQQISIEAQRVRLLDGGRVSADVFRGSGKAGNISIRASESLEIRGASAANATSAILSSLQGGTTGEGGNITIDAGRLLLSKGGAISTGLVGTGNAGNINIRATEVAVSDPTLISTLIPQLISGITVSVAPSGVGQGGSLTLEAGKLHVFNGGQVSSSTLGNGDAGNINLRVSEINVEGISQPLPDGRQFASSISAASTTNANAGSVSLVANSIDVDNGGEISVSNSSGGNAGNLLLSANRIQLDRGGSLRSEVAAGDRGNITLNSDLLQLRRGSAITTNATGTATGGNINITTETLAALENSDIAADAVQGQGGNIQINTQGVFLSFDSDITASSQLGLSGTVDISNPNLEEQHIPIVVNNNFVEEAPVIASSCLNRRNGQQQRFVVTGNGGLSETPDNLLIPYEVTQVRSVGRLLGRGNQTPEINNYFLPNSSIREATGFTFNSDGKVVLVANTNQLEPAQDLICATN